MKIIVDAFGGDHAPYEVLKGCRKAKDELQVQIVLSGDTETIREAAQKEQIDISDFEILQAPDIFDIHAQPTSILREGRQTSLAVGLQALREGKGDAFVSAGNSGGLMAGATFLTKRIQGIKRPALAPVLPTAKGRMILLDAGANTECRPDMLVQFAIMGTAYMQCVKDIAKPRVGLLNVGAEETKGRDLDVQAHALLRKAPVHFCGNVEAREIPSGDYDVVVCDGFSGNVALKLYEGMGAFFKNTLKSWFSGFGGKLAGLFLLNKIRAFQKMMDYKEEGGGVLLGIAYPVIKAHGSSDAKAFFNAIRQAKKCVDSQMISAISRAVAEMESEE